MRPVRILVSLLAVSMFLLSAPALAQEEPTTTAPDELRMTTPYPRVAVEAGDSAEFDLSISAPEPTDVALETSGLPDGWTATFRGGGFEVDGVTAGPTEPEVSLDVNVPVDASEGVYDINVVAEGEDASISLALQVRVSPQAGGEVTLTPDFPGLRVPAGEAASFSVELSNDTPSDLQFELSSSGPAGWDVTAEPSTEPQAATIQVDSGASTTINVDASSPPRAEAGQYAISVQASSPDIEVEAEMIVEIVGSFRSLHTRSASQHRGQRRRLVRDPTRGDQLRHGSDPERPDVVDTAGQLGSRVRPADHSRDRCRPVGKRRGDGHAVGPGGGR